MKVKPVFKIGHVLFKVSDLKTAVSDYEKLGFTVVLGSTPDKATNAMIYLADGSFIELYTASVGKMNGMVLALLKMLRKLNPGKIDRYINYLSFKEGMNDFALDSIPRNGFKESVEYLISEGVALSKPMAMKRVDVDNCERKWNLSFPKDYRLPFFMDDYKPAVKPTIEQITHKNGVLGIEELIINVVEYDYFVDTYKKLTSNYVEEDNQSYFYFDSSCIKLKKADEYHMENITLLVKEDYTFDGKDTHGVSILTKKTASNDQFSG